MTINAGGGTICPAESVAGGDTELLTLLRSFRDRELARSDLGKQYIKLYYDNAAEITSLAIFSRSLRTKMIAALKAIAPAIKKNLHGHQLTITCYQMQKALDVLHAVKKVASPKLCAALTHLESNLNDRSLERIFFATTVK